MIADIRALRSMVEVVDRGSVVAAARACGYSPAAVSRQLARLQNRIGVTLFEPDGRGIRPNDRGMCVAEEARRLIAEVARFEGAMARVIADD